MSKHFSIQRIGLVAISVFIFCMMIVTISSPALAAPQIGIRQPENTGPRADASADSLMGTVVKNAITLVFTICSIGVVLIFLWGATDWILSGGDKEKVAAARRKITTALVGLVVLALSFAIIGLIGSITGINPFNVNIPFLGATQSSSSQVDPTDPNFKCGSSAVWDAKKKKCVDF